MQYRQKLLIATLLGCSLAVTAQATKRPSGEAEVWTNLEIGKLTTKVAASITTFGATFGANMQTKFEMLMAALSVTTKQEAVSGQVQAEGIQKAAQIMVAAAGAQRTSANLTDTYLKFSPKMGQGYDACGTMAKNKSLDRAFSALPHAAMARMGQQDTFSGRMVPSRVDALQARLETHRNKFCTQSEADNGLCTLSPLPGGDTNAALLFEATPAGSLQADARKAFIAHVMGAPDELMPAANAKTADGQQYAFLKNRKDALLSVPAYSLAMIDVANTKSEEMGNRSPNEMLKLRVNQYFGGEEAKSWSANMAFQEPRGLLIEQAKMGGLEIWLRWQQLEQNNRIEANLATLLLASGERFGGRLSAQHRRILADAAAREVR